MSQHSGRPPREDRGTVAETTLTIRLTRSEKAGLEKIVKMRQTEVRRSYGPGASLTMAGYIRSMIARELDSLEDGPIKLRVADCLHQIRTTGARDFRF